MAQSNNPWEEYLASITAPAPPPPPKQGFRPIEAIGQGLSRFSASAPNVLASAGATSAATIPEFLNNPTTSMLGMAADAFKAATPNNFGGQIAVDLGRGLLSGAAQRGDQATPDVPVSVKQSLADYARDQMIQAEIRRRQFDLDNPALQGWGNQLLSAGAQSLAEMGTSLGTGALTALATRNPAAAQAATLGTMGAFNLDRNISAQQQARGVYTDIDYGAALKGAAAQTAVDTMLGRFIGGGDVANALAGKTFSSALARGATAGAVRGAAEEGIAEVIQQGIERKQAGLDLGNASAFKEYGDSFIMGALLGGATGAATGGLAGLQDLKAQQQETKKAEARRAQLQEEMDAERAYQSFFPIQPTEILGLPAPAPKTEALGLPAPEAGPPLQIEPPRMVVDAEGNVRPEPTVGAQPDTFTVTPEGEAVPRGDTYTTRDVKKAFEVTSPEREAERETLVRRAGEEKTIVPETRSPFMAVPMIAVRGQPAYRARILGPSDREGYVRVLNEDTNVVTDVPRKRLVSKPEPKDPDAVAKLPPSVRRAEELRAKDLHQKQIDAILYGSPDQGTAPPARAPEGIPPLPSRPAPTAQEGQTPMVQGEFDFSPAPQGTPYEERRRAAQVGEPQITSIPELAGQAPVAEMPQDTGTDPALFREQGALPFAPDTDFGTQPVEQRPQGMLPFSPETDFGQPPIEPDTTGNLPFEQGLPQPLPPAQEVLPPDTEDLPPLTRNAPKAPEAKAPKGKAAKPALPPVPADPDKVTQSGLTAREEQYNAADPITALEMLAQDAPKYAPIAKKVAETMQRMMDAGHTFTFEIVSQPANITDPGAREAMMQEGTGGVSAWKGALQTTGIYVSAKSLDRYGTDYTQIETIMHEFIHAVTQTPIYYSVQTPVSNFPKQVVGLKGNKFARDLESIRKNMLVFVASEKKRLQGLSLERRAAARSKMHEGLLALIDGRSAALKDANELLAYGMTQPRMLEFYDSVSAKGKTVFTKFMESVREFLGLAPNQNSVLSRIIRAGEGLMNRDMSTDIANTKAFRKALGQNVSSITSASIATKEMASTGQALAGPAVTVSTGPELSAPKTPMSTTDNDAVYVMQQVDAAAQDPAFLQALERALREELRTLGFNGRIPVQLQFNPNASHWALARSNNGQTITIALGLVNDTKDVPGAVQALRPFLTGNVVAFGEQYGLLRPDERAELLLYAKEKKDVDGKTLFETVAERFPGASTKMLEREAIAYAVEHMTRLSPEKWQQEKTVAKKGRTDPRARSSRKKTPQQKTAFDFKAKIGAVGSSIMKAFKDAYGPKQGRPDIAYEIAMRLAKGDVAYRARGDQRFAQPVQFAGWSTPPTQAKFLGEQLRKYMDDMGLSDVGLRMSTAILKPTANGWTAAGKDVLGSYFARTVTLSMAAYNPNMSIEANLETMKRLVDHEVVHALRATGAWTPSQWRNLVAYVSQAKDPATDETYIEKAQRIYGAYTKDMTPAVARDVLNEEAVSMAFAQNFDLDNPVPTGPRNLLSRIAQVLFGVGRASYRAGVMSPEMLTPNGNEIFAAIRSGQMAKQRREFGASSPADLSVKFSIADTAAKNVNPGIDPTPEDVITQANKRNRNPFQAYESAKDLIAWLTGVEERDVPLTQRVPGLSKIFAPLARLEGHDAFLLLKGRTTGAIHDMKQEIAIAIEEAQQIVGNDSRKREQVTAYMEGGWQTRPEIIEDKRLRDLAVALKLRVSQHGRLAVEQGLLDKEAFDRLDGKYLHRMYSTDKNRIFNSIRLLMPDMGWTKSRSNISEIEKINRGEVTDPLVSIANYLAKSGEALLIDRMMDTMAQFSAKQNSDRPWVMDAQDMIQWRGKDWSPLAVEAEIESLRTDVMQASAEWANPDLVRAQRLEVVRDTLKNAQLLLMRNPLWLKLRGLTPADVAAQLGVAPDADTASLPGNIVEDAYNVFLRRQPDVRNNQGLFGAQFKDLAEGVVANFNGDDYVQVPNTGKWGRLRGMLVVREIYDIMNATGAVLQNVIEDRASVQAEQDVGALQKFGSFIGSPEAAQWVMSFYKKAKTVFNPSTHGVNWVGNLVTFETLGGAIPGQGLFYAYKSIGQIMQAQGEAYEVFRDFGGGQTGQHASELTTLADPRFQAALKESMGGLESGDIEMSAKEIFNALRSAWAKIDGSVSGFYQLSDSVFKVAKIQMDMDRGLPPEEAFLNAQDLYLDYTVVPPFIRAIRSLPMGSPFITWTYLMSGQIIDKIGSQATLKVREDGTRVQVPYIVMMAPAFMLYTLANAIAGADDFEDEDKKYLKVGLPSFTDGGQGLLFAGLDPEGRPQYFDIGKYWAGMTLVRLLGKFDDVQESDTRPSGFGGLMKELGFMSDPFSQAMLMMMGYDPNTMKPVSKTGSLPAEGATAQAGALADLMLPPWMGGFSNGTNSLFGDYGLAGSLATRDGLLPYEQGRPALTFGQKAAKLFGITTYITDPMPAMDKKVKEATRLRGLVQGELSRIMEDPALSDEAKAAKAEKVRDRYERMVAREQEMKTMQAEMMAFYGRYRQAVVAKGLPDPYAGDRAQIQENNQQTRKREIDTYLKSLEN